MWEFCFIFVAVSIIIFLINSFSLKFDNFGRLLSSDIEVILFLSAFELGTLLSDLVNAIPKSMLWSFSPPFGGIISLFVFIVVVLVLFIFILFEFIISSSAFG